MLAGALRDLKLDAGVARQSVIVAVFELPTTKASFGVAIGSGASGSDTTVDELMPDADLPGNDYNTTHYPAGTNPEVCAAVCNYDD